MAEKFHVLYTINDKGETTIYTFANAISLAAARNNLKTYPPADLKRIGYSAFGVTYSRAEIELLWPDYPIKEGYSIVP